MTARAAVLAVLDCPCCAVTEALVLTGRGQLVACGADSRHGDTWCDCRSPVRPCAHIKALLSQPSREDTS
jgi:hypothetical protein